mmetsp:Transcript_6000/g.9341  ORF Transcript_6000/g.9341 Transcript_6000/m.9341 type:complete len:327 (+) Transcript_6000:48-1028(+)
MSSDSPKLPPGYRKTALQVIEEEKADLSGKVVFFTGGTAGLGVEAVRALAAAGPKEVVVTARTVSKAEKLVEQEWSKQKGAEKTKFTVIECDLSSLASVESAAKTFIEQHDSLDILLLNAGVMAVRERELTKDGFETQFAVNVLANHVLITLLYPLLEKSSSSRIVIVSSCAHLKTDVYWDDIQCEKNYTPFGAYASSKSGACLLALGWSMKGKSPTSNSLHPGGIATSLQRHMTDEEKIERGWMDKQGNYNPLFKTVPQGAATEVWAAVASELDNVTGAYFEDCALSSPSKAWPMGYAEWITNKENATKFLTILDDYYKQYQSKN